MKKKIIKIIKLLLKKKIKISVAESCTGGLLSKEITSVSGASKIFTMGLVTYSNQAKISILKVPKNIILRNGSVSMQCCLSMVNNLSKISKSRVCVSLTGIAGPAGGTKKKPVGLVYIAFKNKNKTIVNKCNFQDKGRAYIQKATVAKALDLILKNI